MNIDRNAFQAKLFYSYSHKDAEYKENMEIALAQLRQEELLVEWSDRNILSGQPIPPKIKEKMDETDIFVFLLSPDFINSGECMKEWEYAKKLSNEGKLVFRIPIILKYCSWLDFLGEDSIKALPNDGEPITKFRDKDEAWQQIYKGIKAVINQLRETFNPKSEFMEKIEETDFIAQQGIKLQDIYLFPKLSCYTPQEQSEAFRKEIIEDPNQLLEKKYTLIHGQDMSGKTALGRHLFISLANTQSTPVLHIDLKEVPRRFNETIFRDAYHRQFRGDYSIWKKQKDKILILDNLSSDAYLIKFIISAKEIFEKIMVTLSSDTFYSYFKDDTRLADFHEIQIEPLDHKQQEELIRKRLELSDGNEPIPDGRIDQIEDQVNSTINKVVPRYPFFVLSILQTHEKYMPTNFSITAYGHCYQVLIIARLLKTGISHKDDDINTCFNFAEKLAFKIYQNDTSQLDLDMFVKEYKSKFFISESIINRLKNEDYGIITKNGSFRTPYMYYFFLGRFLSEATKENTSRIEQMCEQSHVSSNYLILLFVIHHTNDNRIIDEILLRTMCAFDDVTPAKLNREETNIFRGIIESLPEDVRSKNSVKEERKKERERRSNNDNLDETKNNSEEQMDEGPLDKIYQILKNNEIMGQILRNKYGTLEKPKIKDAIETIADSGLRLVKLLLDEKVITNTADYLHEKYPDYDPKQIKKCVRYASLWWTMENIRKIVDSINVPEIREVIHEVVEQKSTPAYDLIGYFNHLDSVEKLTEHVKKELSTLRKKHKDFFLRRVLSIKTQRYMDTHRSDRKIEQQVCDLLDIKYFHNPSKSKK